MRFTCEKSMLVTGLNIAGRTVAQKSSLSVIEGILCKANQNISLTGYNMETAITYNVEADVSDPGQCILPAKLFGDIIRRLPDGPVTVTAEVHDNRLQVAVEDVGCGIRAEDAQRIFERFVKLDDFKEGLGLGLTYSRTLARRAGGDVVLDTSYGPKGARLVVTL